MKSKVEIAIELAAAGFFVFPLREHGKLPAIKGWQSRATTASHEINQMWASMFGGEPRNLNIGIATEPSGLIVIDVDVKDDRRGNIALDALQAEYGLIPTTMRVCTPSGGMHYYLRGTPITSRVGWLGHGIDIRSRGALVVAPGSETKDGTYEIVES
jgi:hypothetical protein